MIKIFVTILCLCTALMVSAQNRNEPPGNVRESFQKSYPHSQPSTWNHSSVGWSVQFEDRDHDNGEVIAHFDNSGRHIDTHVFYDNNDVPPPVMENLHRRYRGADDYEFNRIERQGEEGMFQVHFRHNKRYRTMYVDDRGHEREYRDRH